MKLSGLITTFITVILALYGQAMAQETDLAGQRHEIQEFMPVNGKKIDHHGIIVNPTPHEMTLFQGSYIDISDGVKINDKKDVFAGDIQFLASSSKGVKLTLDFGEKVAAKAGVKNVSGAYLLNINSKEISIIGYDECGAFYGLQTLRQVMASPSVQNSKLPCMTINDYPDLPLRGVVEGFYGTPWSHEVRVSLIDFLGRFKMNTYVYGPKDDPYHSSPNWRLPYPTDEAAHLQELVQACRRNRVDFVWAIHPGKDIKWNEEDYNNLLHKFNLMYDLGVRQFAIFFDDISGVGTSPSKQTELLNRLTDEFVNTKGDVKSLILCPTDYNKSWANPTPDGSLQYFGNNLNSDIKIFWTGDVVCSDVTKSTLEWVNSRIKRPALFWWNYPVTDYVRNIILQGPAYGLDTSLSSADLSGIVSNPMEHGEASKLALYGIADYSWNISTYNPIDNWERALNEMAPAAADAYRTFAIHSCDTETGYRRDESWETKTFGMDNWNASDAQALKAEFERIEKVPQQMEEGCTNLRLLEELHPWLLEFDKLGTRGKCTIELIEMFRSGNDNAAFWNKYVANIMNAGDRHNYEAHKSGTLKLQSFYENAMDDMAFRFLERLSGKTPLAYRGLSSFPNSHTTQPRLMLDGDTTTFYTSAMPQRKDSWVGVDLQAVRDVAEVRILQGRNSTDDVDFFDHATLECSADGETWVTLIADLQNQYVINWYGDPVKARYVRLKRLDSKRTNYVAVRSFEVNLTNADINIQTNGNKQEAMRAFDLNALSSYNLDGYLTFDVAEGATGYTILAKLPTVHFNIAMLDTNGQTVQETCSSEPFTAIAMPDGTASIKITGTVEIFEIIPSTD